MMNFRKKPVVIQAFQMSAVNLAFYDSWPGWLQSATKRVGDGSLHWVEGSSNMEIVTLEGRLTVSENDYIIKGVKGEIYPCKPDIFTETYSAVVDDEKPVDVNLTFSSALAHVKGGSKVARSGWNGKSMFIFLVNGSTFKVNRPPLLGIYPEGTEVNYHAHIDMRTADGQIVPWLCSQTDMLANDWCLVN
jgi:hypothetical protein